MPQALHLERESPFVGKPGPLRLSSASFGLANPFNAALGASAKATARIRVAGASRVTVRAKGAVTGTVNVQIYPMLADALNDDTAGTRSGFTDAGAALPAAVALANAVENVVTLAIAGSDFVEVEITTAAASSWTATFVDVEVS